MACLVRNQSLASEMNVLERISPTAIVQCFGGFQIKETLQINSILIEKLNILRLHAANRMRGRWHTRKSFVASCPAVFESVLCVSVHLMELNSSNNAGKVLIGSLFYQISITLYIMAMNKRLFP